MADCGHDDCPPDHCHRVTRQPGHPEWVEAVRRQDRERPQHQPLSEHDAQTCRGLYGFVLDDQVKAGYHHQLSGPTQLGQQVVSTWLEAARTHTPVQLRALVRRLQLVPAVGRAAPDQVLGDGDLTYLHLLLPFSGDVFATLTIGMMVDGTAFGASGLWCEWGYLIDLDRDCVTVFRGLQTEPHFCGPWGAAPQKGGCYGIRPVAEATFDELEDQGWALMEHRLARAEPPQ